MSVDGLPARFWATAREVSPELVEVGGAAVEEVVDTGAVAHIEAYNPVGLEYLLMTGLLEEKTEVVEGVLAIPILVGASITPSTTRDWGLNDMVAR